ncbi:MAG: hypothetical protein MRJ92_12780 [Nitrospira sp.]|nr:hypothetical protein [Nitrospira sp.]
MNIVVVSDFAHVNERNATQWPWEAPSAWRRKDMLMTLFAGAGPIDNQIKASSIDVVCTDQYSIADDPAPVARDGARECGMPGPRGRWACYGAWTSTTRWCMCAGWDKVLSSSVVGLPCRWGEGHLYVS